MVHEEGRRDREEFEGEEYEVERELEESRKSSWKRLFSVMCRTESSENPSVGRDIVSGSRGASRSQLKHFVIHPDNWWYVLWTNFILLWAIYSSFFTPMEFGFFRGLPEDLFLLDIAGQFAFLIDIVVHFLLAYRDTHSYRMVYNRKLIALRYLKSRFSVDLLGCLPWDAIFKACGGKEPVRYLLWIRLSRAVRVTEFFEKLEKDIRINYLFTRIVKLIVVELYCTHTAACIFYYLATTLPASEEGFTWIGSLKMGGFSYSNFRHIDLWKRYITSLYFAIVTMATVGYGDIHAVNVREMIFVMVYVSFDMILGAYLLGNMTALIVKGSKTERFRDKMTELRKYMGRNNLERGITKQIQNHLRLQYDRRYTETAVLQDIPVSIRSKISEKLYEPLIKQVSLFKGCSLGFIKQIAIRVHEEFFLSGEVIIEQGRVVDQLYIVCHGELEVEGRGADDEAEDFLMRLHAYSLVGEISFLCNLPHSCTIKAREFCRILRIDKQSFTEILEIYFLDGRIVLNNLLEGKDSNLQNKVLESDISLSIVKHELELVMRLNCAAHEGDFYQLKRLIEAGADPSKRDYDGRSPLHIAASRGYEKITEFLIEQGLDVNIADKFGNTPLLEAIRNGNDQVVDLLVRGGASLKIDDAGCFLCMIVAKRDCDLLKRVLANGINPNSKNYDYRTALHVAAAEGLYSMASLLLEAGGSVLSKDRWGNSPIDEARMGGNKGLIKLLEAARNSEISNCGRRSEGASMEKKKCSVFAYHPWDPEGRKEGILMWVPNTMEELIIAAKIEFDLSDDSYCILSEDGAKILDINMVTGAQKLFLVNLGSR
ncbi:potassium channel SKOR-like isoform X2 [Carica papaya]|uniref:potassium channel SKOR-like isoform X2 n=1 Tax=Carica papaya TaxID=3649 RepID=UPI000B8CA1F8|nr:potassium channel SKOR-like isoform X2 [Carica papaya]